MSASHVEDSVVASVGWQDYRRARRAGAWNVAIKAFLIDSNVHEIKNKDGLKMTKSMFVVFYIVMMIAVVVSVDFLFFKNRFWERLMVNIGIVLVFAGFYLRFLKNL